MTTKPYFVPLRFGIGKLLLWGAFVLLFTLILVSNVAAQTCTSPPSGLVSWWPGDGNADDIIGGNNGTMKNGATFSAGLVGQAFSLDGSDDWVDLGTNVGNIGAGEFTFDLWVKFDSLEGEQVLIEKYVETYDENTTGWPSSKLPPPDNKIFGILTGDAAVPGGLTIGTWHHIASTFSGGTTGSGTALFIDGRKVAGVNGPPGPTITDNAVSLKLGHRGHPDDTLGSLDIRGFYLNGLIDEVEIFDRALSAAEILAIYNAGSAGKCKGGILAQALIALVFELNLHQGISNALDAKLSAVLLVLDDLSQNKDGAAINMLNAFIQNVEAQRGNKLTDAQADELRDAAQAIIDVLSG